MDAHADTQRRWSTGPLVLAWAVIAVICGTILILPFVEGESDPDAEPVEDRIGLILMRLQAQYLIGATEWLGPDPMFYRQAKSQLYQGTVSQRQRFVVVAAEMRDLSEARDVLHDLDRLIEIQKERTQETAGRGFSLTEEQRAIQTLLHVLYNHEDIDEPQVDALTQADRALLTDELGWFGDLGFAHRSVATDAQRREVMDPAKRTVIILVVGFLGFLVGLLTGGIALLIWLILLVNGMVFLRYVAGVSHHGVYVETFAIWLAMFVGLQMLPVLVSALEGFGLLYPLVIFFFSLVVLGWPVVRGVSWSQVRRDLGLTLVDGGKKRPALEPLFGALGYVMALPMLLVGVVITLIAAMFQQLLAGPNDVLGPTAGPAHPIVEGLADGSWLTRAQLFVLAVVAAPIVEEIMFRGALYRHLRDGSRALGRFASVIASGLLNTFIFAAIHPQGLIAVPLLMSLAFMFVLLREWRNSVVPAIVMHALSNGIVVTLMMLALGA